MSLTSFAVDVAAVIEKRRTLIDETAGIGPDDLRALTVELYDRLEELTTSIDDRAVVFVPADAVSHHAMGINHARGHLAQVADIRRQTPPPADR